MEQQLPMDLPQGPPVVVGCALLPKKVARYLTQRMLQTAADHNILLKQIDYTQPLEPQGPFHVIIHKLRPNPDWEQQLRQYVAAHPDVVVVDSIDKIRQLHNRSTMLRPLQGDGILLHQPQHTTPQHGHKHHQHGHNQQQGPAQRQGQVSLVQAPLQVELGEGTTEAQAQAALAAAGLAPPLLCKPLWTDGRDGSHKLAVLHDLEALGRLLRGAVCHEFKPPLVVQQFVEHGGVLFKVYVLGAQTYVTARPSLGETELEPAHAVQQLPRISCVSVFSKQQQHQGQMQQPHAAGRAPPPAAVAAGGGPAGGAAQHSSAGSQGAAVQPSSGSASVPVDAAPSLPQNHNQQQQQQQPSAALAAVTAESMWRPPSSIVAPPAWLTSALAATLRRELGMQLFNFDLIVPEQQPLYDSQQQQQQVDPSSPDAAPALCYVVDINFFPGVDKIPDFEHRFVQFLLAAANSKGSSSPGSAPAGADAEPQQQQQQECAQATAAAGAVAMDPNPGGSCVLQAGRPGSGLAGAVGSSDGSGRRSSSGGSGRDGSSRRLQHSLSADRATAAAAAASLSTPGAAGISSQHSRRLSGSGGGGSSRHGSGLDAAAVAAAQWGERGVLGSSPPQLQVAGCS